MLKYMYMYLFTCDVINIFREIYDFKFCNNQLKLGVEPYLQPRVKILELSFRRVLYLTIISELHEQLFVQICVLFHLKIGIFILCKI